VTLGVGVGGRDEDYRALGRDHHRRFTRLDEQVAAIRGLWSGEPPGEGLDPVGPRPVHTIPILSGALGPKSIRRSAVWADGVAGFEMDPTRDAFASARSRVDAAWEAAGRDTEPYRMTSFWFALGDDAPGRLRAYARDYLGVFGPELADAIAASCTAHSADAVRRALDDLSELGFDEVQLVPTTGDIAELDRLTALVQAV